MVRSALRRCLALACVVAGGGADVAHLERLERLERLDAWLASNTSAAPPAHWAVTAPSDVRAGSGFVLESGQKQVVASQLTGTSGAQVIVKALRKAAGPFAFGDRASDIAYFELVYLEYLRGAPGVPLLHGGWETRSHVFWVTSHDGLPIATGKGTHAHPMRPPAPPVPRRARGARPPKRYYLADYDRRATEEPVALAIAWLRCLRSFGERGGFVLTDFKPEQFTLDSRGRISLNHHGCRYADCANATGAPELAACEADGACARFDWRAHVFDAATRSWIFPRIISLARDRGAAKRLKKLLGPMTARDPRDRPQFSALLRDLAS
ncbi:hypothetical protein SO694_00187041 [Aureococcus anophagefferens]|uniref:Protein kinase domain-containing protein n=1 Tax=Aureococcus anophagefferens TaxID=44056 RepID=A0ABR1FG94_AURAN